MTIDASELKKLAYDLGNVDSKVIPKVKPVVSKGALNIKQQLQREARESTHFKGKNPAKSLANSIGYELNVTDDGVEAEIGPDTERSPGAGLLGAYWGWSRGGGGTLPDPLLALEDEEPRFVESMAKVAGFVFD